VTHSGWGLAAKNIPSREPTGAWAFDPVLKTAADLEKITTPQVREDEEETKRRYQEAQDLFGDILEVRLKGVSYLSFSLMGLYTGLRGLEQTMEDMCLDPDMLDDAMTRLEQAHQNLIRQYEKLDLLSLNNDGTYHSSGGIGYTDELPQADCDPECIRPCDMWASAQSQELAQVSPEMHYQFALQHERRLLKPFGLAGYGCCEPLTQKLDYVFTIPNLRRISISPWADVETCAEKLQDKYIFSWKPHPAGLVGAFDPQRIHECIKHTLNVTRDCVIEIILKDTHTCENHPERFTRWTEIARRLVENC
jgi:hypothetical protein